jgi:hypothetical protein
MAKEAVEDWRRKQQVRAVALPVEALLFFPKSSGLCIESVEALEVAYTVALLLAGKCNG